MRDCDGAGTPGCFVRAQRLEPDDTLQGFGGDRSNAVIASSRDGAKCATVSLRRAGDCGRT